jgi:uncharacterized repeat protein (TIGR03803 family)
MNGVMNNSKGFTLRVSAICFGIALGALVISSFVGTAHIVLAQNPAEENVVFNFTSSTGDYPTGVVRDSAGNFYVGNDYGGSNQRCTQTDGCGNVLKVSASGPTTELYAFMEGYAQVGPSVSGLIRDAKGNLYGTTLYGGPSVFHGTVFRIAPSGVIGTLHTFFGVDDGNIPAGGVTLDSEGNLYGTTVFGGGTGCDGEGCGTFYKVTPSGSETVLYSFTGGAGGREPETSPIIDSAGNLYGTALYAGDLNCSLIAPDFGCGTVWKLDTSGNLTSIT